MNEKVTLFITSCGRPELLKRTLESFVEFNTYPLEDCIICEDSGISGINDFVYDIVNFPCKIIYNEKRVGQMLSIQNGVKYIKTPYVFHCEEDWRFYDYGFIEISMEILKSNNEISQVLLRSYKEYFERYNLKIMDIGSSNYNLIKEKINDKYIYSFNPSLRRIEIELLKIPYEKNDDEGTIQTKIRELGYISVVTKKENGFVEHIGWNDHVF